MGIHCKMLCKILGIFGNTHSKVLGEENECASLTRGPSSVVC